MRALWGTLMPPTNEDAAAGNEDLHEKVKQAMKAVLEFEKTGLHISTLFIAVRNSDSALRDHPNQDWIWRLLDNVARSEAFSFVDMKVKRKDI